MKVIIYNCVYLILAVSGTYGCTTVNNHNELDQVAVKPSPGRIRRDVSLEDRLDCGPEDEGPTTRVNTSIGINQLRDEMRKRNLDAYIIPSGDENHNEYVADADQRRAYVSGFTGSAGIAVVTLDKQALWTDGRYFLQAENQLFCDWLLMKEREEDVPTIKEWLKQEMVKESKVGVDPRLIPADTYMEYEKELLGSGILLTPVDTNLVDEIWPDEVRPAYGTNPVFILEQEFAGKSWQDKVFELREVMAEKQVDLLVVTATDEVAWLFNLRGDDIPYNTVFRSYVLMDMHRIVLFLPDGKITPAVDHHLGVNRCEDEGGICLDIQKYSSIVDQLRAMAASPDINKVLLPKKYAYSGGASYALVAAVPEEKRLLEVSPIIRMKGRKNEVEFKGMENAHMKDAVALISFLAFLEEEINNGNEWDEITASDKLKTYREEQEHFFDLSFETISAFGPNGAIIHYRPTPQTVAKITKDNLYLLDSGGQYKDGTTDVTRTLHYGTPTPYQMETYTRVLMGALDLASLTFPKGVTDVAIDVLARRPLYEVGLDYKHGTGHGIGMFLSIHESPTQLRIKNKERHEMEVGQFFSDEPGYYKDFEFGIRLETVLAVVKRETKYNFGQEMLGFQPITLVPFEPKLINSSMLSVKQCAYLNGYHALVRSKISPLLQNDDQQQALDWLQEKTMPIQCMGEKLEPISIKAEVSAPVSIMNSEYNVKDSDTSASMCIDSATFLIISSLTMSLFS